MKSSDPEYTKNTGALQLNDLRELLLPVPYSHEPPAIVVSQRQYDMMVGLGFIRHNVADKRASTG
jgi:hypothetical protein